MFTLNGLCAVGRGYVGSDVELRHLNGGRNRAVVEVPISFQRYYKGGDGKYVRTSHFIQVVFYGSIAERFAKSASKGTMVNISGYIEQESFTIKGSDKKATKHRLIAEDFHICEKPTQNDQAAPSEQENEPEQQAPPLNNKATKPVTTTKLETQPQPESGAEDDDSEGAPDLPF